jgi:hypothetical protein
MRVSLGLALGGLCGFAVAAWAAQQPYPDVSQFATSSQVQAIQNQIPLPAASVPPPEVVGGSIGAASTYRRGDAVQPRITRSTTVTLDVTGTATFDWTAQGALVTPVQLILTPIYTGTSVPICYATAVSATAGSIKCMMVSTANLTLALVTAGLNLFGASASGMQVGIVALPKS